MKKLFKQSRLNKAKGIKSADDKTYNMKLGRVALLVAVACASTYLSACAFREFLNQAKPQSIEIAEIQVHKKVNKPVSIPVKLSVTKIEPARVGVEKVKSEYEIRKENLCKLNNITAEEYDMRIESGEGVGVPNDIVFEKTNPFQDYIDEFFKKYPVTKVNLKELQNKNSGVIGWIKIPVLGIDEPVVIAKNADCNYYLEHDLNGNPSKEGCIELDFQSEKNTVGVSSNSILYGHNMFNGNKFGNLKKLLNPNTQEKLGNELIEYYDSDNGGRLLKIVSVFIIDENDSFYNSAKTYFYNEDFWIRFKNNIQEKNIVSKFNEIGTVEGNHYLSLSTCYGIGDNGQRLVVVAKQVSCISVSN